MRHCHGMTKNSQRSMLQRTGNVDCLLKESSNHPPLHINGIELDRLKLTKQLGVRISGDLKWDHHISAIVSKASG